MLYAAIVGTAARLLLAWSGVGASLAWRIEVSTAANSNLELREGLALLRLGVSPYTGSSCRTPPLALWLYDALADHDLLYVLPNTILDLLAASLLYHLALDLLSVPRRNTDESSVTRDNTGIQGPAKYGTGVGIGAEPSCEPSTVGPAGDLRSALPSALAWAYLLNPFTLAASAGGTTSSLENLAVVASLYGACTARHGLATLGLAASTYMSLHAAVLLFPIACLLSYGPEDVATPLHMLQQKVCRIRAGGSGDGVPFNDSGICVDDSDGVMDSSCKAETGNGPPCGQPEEQEKVELKQQEQQQQKEQKSRRKQAGAVNFRQGLREEAAEDEAKEADRAAEKGTDAKSVAGATLSEAIAAAVTATVGETDDDDDDDKARKRLKRGGTAGCQQDMLPRSASRSSELRGPSPPSRPGHGRPGVLLQPHRPPAPLLPWRQLLYCIALTAALLALLVTASDLFLLSLPPPPGTVMTADGSGAGGSCRVANTCILGAAEELMARLPPGPAATEAAAGKALRAAGSSLASCWAVRVYGSQVLLDDATPNVGQWWYLSMEVFNDAKAYLRLLAHSLLFALALPLAMRLGVRRPLALFLIQLLCLGFNKPYPSVADIGLAAPMLLLLGRQQLAAARLRLLLPASLLLLCVLGPAMQRMWLSYESANSNFFYSITLLYGVWQVVLLGHVLGLTLWLDRLVRGKELLS